LCHLAVGEQKGGDVGVGRHLEPASFDQSDVFFQPDENRLGLAAFGGLDGLFELLPAPAKADLEAA